MYQPYASAYKMYSNWRGYRAERAKRMARGGTYGQRAAQRARWGTVRRQKRWNGGGKWRKGGYYGRYNTTHTHARPELKFHDINLDLNPISLTGSIFVQSINEIEQGVGESQRIGRKILLKKFSFRYALTMLTQITGPNSHDEVRVIIYLDKQANGGAATPSDILQAAVTIHSFRDLENVGRFRILAERNYALNSYAGAGDGTTNAFAGGLVRDEIHINLNTPVEFSFSTGAITEIKSNNIGILLISLHGRSKIESKMRTRFEG